MTKDRSLKYSGKLVSYDLLKTPALYQIPLLDQLRHVDGSDPNALADRFYIPQGVVDCDCK